MSSEDKDLEPQDVEADSGPNVDSDEFAGAEVAEEPEFEDNAQTPPAPAAHGRSSLLPLLVLFVAVLLLAAGAWYWHQTYYQPRVAGLSDRLAAADGLGTELAGLAARVDAVDASTVAVAEQIETDVGEITASLASLKSAQADLKRSVGALFEKETQTSVDWLLAEAEYLVLAATQRLALERDIDTAIAALRAADQRLRSVEHPDLIPIRDQLIKDIAALEGVNRADVEGLALYLAESVGLVDSLPTKPIAEEVTPFSSVRKGEYAAEDWRKLGLAIWSDLVELVEVKDADLPDSVLFDPELRYFLQQNLKLELASARLAVLRRDKANLEASATLIKRLLDAYYDETDAGVKSIAARLDEAAAMELAPALPNISGSLDVIRKYRAERVASAGSGQ